MTDVRNTQTAVESAEASTAAAVRATQVVAEVGSASTISAVQLTQFIVEVVFPFQCMPLPSPVVLRVLGCPVLPAPSLVGPAQGCQVPTPPDAVF